MSIPNWYAAALLALAAYRTWSLIAEDEITSPWRARLDDWASGKWGSTRADKIFDFITCPWCTGWWIAIGWWGAYQLWEHAALVAAVPFALSVGVGALASVLRKN